MIYSTSYQKSRGSPLWTLARAIIILYLDEAISFHTTFHTPFGRLRFIRMPLGLTVAGDAFQSKLHIVSNNLDFCTCTTDDMIILGKETDGSDHEKHVKELLQVTRQQSLKLKLDKVKFKTKQASFFWTSFTCVGQKPENEKVQDINNM